jgi:hypothetical protein
MSSLSLTLVGKPGCHLCDDARTVLVDVLAQIGATRDIVLNEVSILDDAALHELYVEEIPVVLINGKVHNYWRIDPVRLRTALLEAP